MCEDLDLALNYVWANDSFIKQGTNEYAGPCPLCGGKDRFILFTDQTKARFMCRQCKFSGSLVELVRKQNGFENCSAGYAKAYEILGLGRNKNRSSSNTFRPAASQNSSSVRTTKPTLSSHASPQAIPLQDAESKVVSPQDWKAQGMIFFENSLTAAQSQAGYEALLARGLYPDFAAQIGIGWNPAPQYQLRDSWGLKIEDPAHPKILLPPGIVLASFRKDESDIERLVNLTVRVNERWRKQEQQQNPFWHDKEIPKYWQITGSENVYFVVGSQGTPLVRLESALDAALIAQDSEMEIAAIASMGGNKKPDNLALSYMRSALCNILCNDNDKAGINFVNEWQNSLPNATQFPLPQNFKDLGDARQADTRSVLTWLAQSVPQALYESGFTTDQIALFINNSEPLKMGNKFLNQGRN